MNGFFELIIIYYGATHIWDKNPWVRGVGWASMLLVGGAVLAAETAFARVWLLVLLGLALYISRDMKKRPTAKTIRKKKPSNRVTSSAPPRPPPGSPPP